MLPQPLPACVMLGRLSLSLFICLVGLGRRPRHADRIDDKVCVAHGTITHGDAWSLWLTALRPGRVVFSTPSKVLPPGYIPKC